MFKGFTSSSQSDLSPRQELELAKLNLKSARKASDPKLAFVLCNSAGDALSKIPRSISPKDTEDHPKHEEVATAYSELGELFNELGQSDKAQANYKKAEKWGWTKQPLVSTKNTVTVGNPTLLSGEPGSERDIDLIPQDIFAENMRPPGLSFRPPEPNGRLNDTPQLACCLSLLQASHSFEEIQEPLTRNWLQETQKDMDEQERLKRLATDVIREFSRDELKDSMAVSEVVYLAPVLEKDVFRSLLKQFYSGIERSELLDYHQLEGLAQLIQGAGSAYLDADDLVKILQLLSARLRDTHKQSPHYIYQLTLTVSRVLDAMADTKVKGLDREKLHEPLSLYLEGLKRSSDPYLVFQAAYAYQALQYVPDNETLWQATLRRSGKVIQGVSGLVSAVKGLDLNGFIDGLVNIQQGLGGASSAFQFVKSTYRDVTSLAESGMGFLDCMKEGLSFECKRSWYPALRGADTLIREGHLAKFKKLVCEAPCRLDPAFQWGVCQLLRDVAANAMWDADTRQGAVVFLGEIYRNDTAWGQQASIKQWILDILMQLSTFSRGDMECVETLLRVLESDGDAKKQELYQLCRVNGPSPHAFKPALPLMAFPTLIDRVQHRPDVEGSIRQLRRQRLKERGHSVYIPPQAKANLQAPDETRFPLMDRVHNFLSSDQKVFLLLGDSGSGKSTFSRALESDLWDAYNKDSSIPLYISLPTIEKPEHDMIEKHLRRTSFTEAQIKELKLYRKFVLICDGYDETQQSYNLYMRNRLNQPGEWSVQMVVSCRSEQVGADYRDRFQPVDRNRRQGSGLFQEAVMTPFSIDQIQDYIKEYVSTYQPLWKTEDYLQTLDLVPSLKDLVKNPFLLTLSLEVLPRMVDPGQTLSASLVTRVTLYDQFVEQWLERGKKRLGEKELSFQARSAFDSLSDEGFAQNGIDFLKRLAVAIYKEQNGQPVVEYSRFKDEGTWKEAFFSRDNDEKQLLREACPLTRSGNQYRFVHRSILEYGMARAIFDPQDRDRKTEPPQLSDRRKSVSSDWSFESRDSSEEVTTETEPSFLDTSSPLVWKNIVDEPSILQFLSERVQQQPVFRKQLLIYIEYSKSDASWRTAAANAITILVRGGVRFNGADLKGIHVPGADLSHGFFDSADLQEADLRKVKLNRTWLRQSNLSKTRMTGTRFGELPMLKQDSTVHSFTYSPDGKTLAVGLGSGDIVVYSTSYWERVVALRGHFEDVSSVAFSPKSNMIISGGYDSCVRLWDVETGTCFKRIEGHGDRVTCVAFSPLEDLIASSSRDLTVRLWEVDSGACRHVLEGNGTRVHCVAFSPQGTEVAAGYTGEVRLWNVETGTCSQILSNHVSYYPVECITYSPKGDLIASGSGDRTVHLWDVESRSTRHILHGHDSGIESVVFSPHGDQVATGSGDNTVRLWDVETGACTNVITGHTARITTVAYSLNGSRITSGGEDNTVRLWDVEAGAYRGNTNDQNATVVNVKCSPSGSTIAAYGRSTPIELWDVKTGLRTHVLRGHTEWVQGMAYSPTGELIASSSTDETVRLWDVETGSCLHILRGHGGLVSSVAFSPQGDQLISGCLDNTARLWNVRTGVCSQILAGHTNGVQCVAYSARGDLVASAGSDRTVRLWDIKTGECLHTMTGHDGSVSSVAFSPQGTQVASASGDNTVRLWDTKDGGCQYVLTGHSKGVTLVMYLPTGSVLASCSDDGTARIWNVETGICNHILSGHKDKVLDVAYSPASNLFVTGGRDQTARLWDGASGQCRAVIDDFFGRVHGVAWCGTSDTNSLVTGSFDGSLRLWQVKEEEESYRISLDWSSTSDVLVTSSASIQDAEGLSPLNKLLLKQRGAVGKPVFRLDDEGHRT